MRKQLILIEAVAALAVTSAAAAKMGWV